MVNVLTINSECVRLNTHICNVTQLLYVCKLNEFGTHFYVRMSLSCTV